MRVPHESKTGFGARGVGYGSRGRSRAGLAALRTARAVGLRARDAARSPRRCIRTEVRATTVPGAVGEQIRIRQGRRTAARDISERRLLHRLFVILAPLEIVDLRLRCSTRVIAICIWTAGGLRVRIVRSWVVPVRVPIQAFRCPVENSVESHPWSRRGGELQGSS